MQGSEYGRDSAVIVGRLAVANPHVLVVATHKLQKNASFKFHIFDNIYWTYLTYFTSLCSTCSVTSSWATKYNFIICLASSESSVLKRFFHWNLFTNNSWINTSTRTTKAWILLNSSKSCVSTKKRLQLPLLCIWRREKTTVLHVLQLLGSIHQVLRLVPSTLCLLHLCLHRFKMNLTKNRNLVLSMSYIPLMYIYILRRSVPEVVAASVFLPARIFAEVVDALSRSTPSAKAQDHFF